MQTVDFVFDIFFSFFIFKKNVPIASECNVNSSWTL